MNDQPNTSRCALAAGSLPALSAEQLIRRWRSEADVCSRAASDYAAAGRMACSRQALDRSYAFAQCAKELHTQLAAANERQPEENTKISHAPLTHEKRN